MSARDIEDERDTECMELIRRGTELCRNPMPCELHGDSITNRLLDEIVRLRAELVALSEEAVANRENARIGQWVKDNSANDVLVPRGIGSLKEQFAGEQYRLAALTAGREPS